MFILVVYNYFSEVIIMRQGWTSFNKVLLIISMIAGFIMVIVLTVYTADSYLYNGWAWAVFVGGAFLVLSFHALWGLFVEMSENIAQLTNKNDTVKDDTSLPWTCPNCNRVNNKNPNFCANCKMPRNIKSNVLRWTCQDCGRSNHVNLDFCQNCGKPRNHELSESDNTDNPEIKAN